MREKDMQKYQPTKAALDRFRKHRASRTRDKRIAAKRAARKATRSIGAAVQLQYARYAELEREAKAALAVEGGESWAFKRSVRGMLREQARIKRNSELAEYQRKHPRGFRKAYPNGYGVREDGSLCSLPV